MQQFLTMIMFACTTTGTGAL
uniref:Uncharacterized protein n=1 Tax=Rhizophora mucronata TaxID=61149 RepID=A0A2P2PAS6_RHIMU